MVVRTGNVKMQPKIDYTLDEQGPFLRACLRVYGRTPIDAFERARVVRNDLATELPDSTCWAPVYRGFASRVRRHCAEISIALGGDREDARRRIDLHIANQDSSAK